MDANEREVAGNVRMVPFGWFHSRRLAFIRGY
jgi:hypothetical protein